MDRESVANNTMFIISLFVEKCNIMKDTNEVNEIHSDTITTELQSYSRILNKLEHRGNRFLETRANAYFNKK